MNDRKSNAPRCHLAQWSATDEASQSVPLRVWPVSIPVSIPPSFRSQFKIDAKSYLERYYIGHYNPLGNQFTAFAIKNKLVEMLDPKPTAYPSP